MTKIYDPVQFTSLVYEAAVEPSLWPEVLSLVADYLGGDGAAMISQDIEGAGGAVLSGIDPETIPLFFGDFRTNNPVLEDFKATVDAISEIEVPPVQTDRTLIDRSLFTGTPFFNDFLRRFDINSIFFLGLARSHSGGTVINIVRPTKKEEFDPKLLQFGREMQPHLIRAFHISKRLNLANAQGQTLIDFVSRLSQGVFLLDTEGALLHCNGRAERLLADGDGLLRRGRTIGSKIASVDKTLQELIGRALPVPGCERGGGAIVVPRLSKASALSVNVVPVGSAGMQVFGRTPAVLVYASAPEFNAQNLGELARAFYQLTQAETGVALALLDGLSPKQIAERQNISVRTVRTHLATVFRKTSTGRQADLVRLLSQLSGLNG